MKFPKVRVRVLLTFELFVGTQGTGKILGGMDLALVLVPSLLLNKLFAKTAKLVILIFSSFRG